METEMCFLYTYTEGL